MISDEIRRFIEGRDVAMVASADASGRPHIAMGSDIKALDGEHIIFENWFCQTTLSNVEQNPRVAVTIMAEEPPIGYQLIGSVVHGSDVALLDGYQPGRQSAEDPQALTRLVVRVEEVLAFCGGLHNDLPLGGEDARLCGESCG